MPVTVQKGLGRSIARGHTGSPNQSKRSKRRERRYSRRGGR